VAYYISGNEVVFSLRSKVELVHETDQAVLIRDCALEVWLPKSQITVEEHETRADLVYVYVPEWLAEDKGLI